MRRERRRPRAGALAAVLTAALTGTAALTAADPPVHLREIYVPYAEFKARVAGDPQGVVMELAEYRELVLRALSRPREAPVELPPLEATVLSALYTGRLEGRTARFEARLQVRALADGWTRCDLGAPLVQLGSVSVDGQPGWLVHEPAPLLPNTPIRAHLLLHGRGAHDVRLTFSLPVSEDGDRSILKGALVAAPSARVELALPWPVDATSDPPVLETAPAGDGTRLVLAAGNGAAFQIAWKRRRGAGDAGAYLAAEHRIAYSPLPEAPTFAWTLTARIERRPVDSLLLVEPPGGTVLRVFGPAVNAWERTAGGIRVQLAAPSTGEVTLRAVGVLAPPAAGAGPRFELGPPGLAGAAAERGWIALEEPRGHRLAVDAATAAVETALDESGGGSRLARSFAFTAREARVSARVIAEPAAFETRAAFRVIAGEEAAALDGSVHFVARQGRIHRLAVSLPRPWRLVRVEETPGADSAAHGLRLIETNEATGLGLLLELTRAIEPGRPLSLRLTLEQAYPAVAAAGAPLELSLPAFPGAERTRTDLALRIPSSMDARLGDLPGWRALATSETEALGPLETTAVGETLVSALTTRDAAPRLALTLVPRASRGEERIVTHLLALERRIRCRADLLLAVVDRPVSELTLQLPAGTAEGAIVLGEGIKETTADAAQNRRTVRFSTPWTGTRRLRVEYEAAQEPGIEAPLPVIDLVPAAGAAFGGERFLVLQSRGPVEIAIQSGPGLLSAEVDEVPDFAAPWDGGRLLTAHRYRAGRPPGTFRTTVHERAPVLSNLARELRLVTVIGKDGTSRTRAEIALATSQRQRLDVRLPAGAQAIAVAVNDEPIRAVRPGTAGVISVPLPPQSHATVALVYERSRPGSSTLGSSGEWNEDAPVLEGIPVGETRWTVHFPAGHRFVVRGGNLQPEDPRDAEDALGFPGRVLRWLRSGRPPFAAWESDLPGSGLASVPALAPAETGPAQAQQTAAPGQLAAREVRPGLAAASRRLAPRYALLPEGHSIATYKLGSDARLELGYRAVAWSTAARRGVFLGTLLLGWALLARRGARVLVRFAVLGLVIAIAVPLLAGRASPLLAEPLAEGLSLVLLAGLAIWPLEHVRRSRLAASGVTALLLGAALAAGPAMLAGVPAMLAGVPVALAEEQQQAATPLPPLPPLDGVLLPYDPGKPGLVPGDRGKVYLPREKFQALWQLAHPAEKTADLPPPRDIVLGDAAYTLRLEGQGAYRIAGTIALNVLTDRWVALPLPLDRGRVARVTIDGAEAALTSLPVAGRAEPQPVIGLRGRGVHTLGLEIVGTAVADGGELRAAAAILAGACASLRAELPPGVRVRSPVAIAVTEAEQKTVVAADLGGASAFELSWSIPRVEGSVASQSESLSYTALALTLEGYDVDRVESLRVTGRPADAFTYRLLGDWEITEVNAADLAEWSVVPDAADLARRTLQIFFTKPVSQATLRIRGHARLAVSGPLAALALREAARVESFVALHHGGARRFAPAVLGGMTRASPEDLARTTGIQPDPAPDRLYHAFHSGENEVIAVEPRRGEASLTTEIAIALLEDRLALGARSRYTVTAPGPFRHEVRLPAGWSVRTVAAPGLRDWEVVDEPAGRRLVISWATRAPSGAEIAFTAELPRDLTAVQPGAPPATVELPHLAALPQEGVTLRESQVWAVAAADGLELSVLDAGTFTPLALEAAPRWLELPEGSSYRLGWRLARVPEGAAGPAARLAASRRTSQLGATVVALVRLAEEAVHVNARLQLRVRLGTRDRFRVRLPAGAQLTSLETLNQQSRDVQPGAAGTDVEVILQSPVTGSHALDIAYRLPRPDDAVPALVPIAILDGATRLAEVDTYVGVLESSTGLAAVVASTGLVPVTADSLPFVLEGVPAASLRPTYRATALDWSLGLEERAIEVTPGPAAIVELAEVSTIIGEDGTARSRAVYTVRNHHLQFLVLELPAGAELWGVSLNGKPAAVGEAPGVAGGGRRLRVPVEHVGAASLSLEVAVVYEERRLGLPALRGSAALVAPHVVDTQVVETVWNVRFPAGYTLTLAGGNVREVAGSIQYAKKVENLLGQLEKVEKAAAASTSRRVRAQALREKARLDQSLGDNIAELSLQNRSSLEVAQSARIGEEEIATQWSWNDAVLERSQAAHEGLKQARAADLAAKAAGTGAAEPLSKEEQRFNEATSSLLSTWRGGGATPAAQTQGQPPAGQAAGPRLVDFLETPPPPAAAPAAGQAPAPPATGRALDGAAGGLQPLPELLTAGAVPGLEAPPQEPRGLAYTFVAQGGEAHLELAYTRDDAWPRLAAGLALVGLAAVLLWRRQRP